MTIVFGLFEFVACLIWIWICLSFFFTLFCLFSCFGWSRGKFNHATCASVLWKELCNYSTAFYSSGWYMSGVRCENEGLLACFSMWCNQSQFLLGLAIHQQTCQRDFYVIFYLQVSLWQIFQLSNLAMLNLNIVQNEQRLEQVTLGEPMRTDMC